MKGFLMRILFVALTALLLGACQSVPDKYPEFDYTKPQIREYKSEFRKADMDILFFVMVDRSGKVVKVRTVDRDKDRVSADIAYRFEMAMFEAVKADPVGESEPEFRQFVQPISLDKEITLYQ